MASCKDVYGFLSQVSARNVTGTLAAPDEALLTQLQLLQFFTADELRQLQSEVAALGPEQAAIVQEQAQRQASAQALASETAKTRSILFHLEGHEKQDAERQQVQTTQANLQAIDADLAKKLQAFGQLVARRTLLDTATPCGPRFVAITPLGAVAARDLAVRLYRYSDSDFPSYWAQMVKISQDLDGLAVHGAEYYARLGPALPGAEKSYLWSIGIGLSKAQPNADAGASAFVAIYNRILSLSPNLENRLMASEVLTTLPRPLDSEYPTLVETLSAVRRLGVPSESALGVTAILDLGRREDGTIALPNLQQFLSITRSYESASLLAILNVPTGDLTAKFQSLRAMFGGWGYQPSEDVELASAYLAISELPADGVATKLAIIARGLGQYLQYPLVAAAILASIGTLEANETLNVLERAYEVVGRRAMPMSQAELICLAIRMVHGIRDELVGQLDTTAVAAPAAPRAPVHGFYGPGFFFVPIIVAHQAYFSTYSGIGGAHPGHVHGFGGGGGFVG